MKLTHLHQSEDSAVGNAEKEQDDECASGCPHFVFVFLIVLNTNDVCEIYGKREVSQVFNINHGYFIYFIYYFP